MHVTAKSQRETVTTYFFFLLKHIKQTMFTFSWQGPIMAVWTRFLASEKLRLKQHEVIKAAKVALVVSAKHGYVKCECFLSYGHYNMYHTGVLYVPVFDFMWWKIWLCLGQKHLVRVQKTPRFGWNACLFVFDTAKCPDVSLKNDEVFIGQSWTCMSLWIQWHLQRWMIITL